MPLADHTSMPITLPSWCLKRLAAPLGLHRLSFCGVEWWSAKHKMKTICKKLPCHLGWGLGVFGRGRKRVLCNDISTGRMLNKSCVKLGDIKF